MQLVLDPCRRLRQYLALRNCCTSSVKVLPSFMKECKASKPLVDVKSPPWISKALRGAQVRVFKAADPEAVFKLET